MQKNNIFGKNIMNHSSGSACIIAEVGINHDGNFEKARKLIDVAAKSGCSCVKFQTVTVENMMSVNCGSSSYIEKGSKKGETFFELSKRVGLSYDEHRELFRYSASKGIPWIASFFDKESLDFLVELNVPVLKVASGEITDFPLLKEAAKTKIPMIISTGMATMEEIDETISFLRVNGAGELYLMHCVSWYPADINDMNIRVIGTLFEKYNIPVGLSDHTLGISVATGARARGVKLFEKHFTLSKDDFGPDHSASLEPDELAQMVISIDEVGRCLGSGEKTVSPIELEQRKVHRKSIVAKSDIGLGTVLTKDMIATKRPGTGIPPKYLDEIVGYIVQKDIGKDEVITWEMIRSPD